MKSLSVSYILYFISYIELVVIYSCFQYLIEDTHDFQEPLSVSADFDPNAANSVMTPCKRINPEASEDVESVQLSSTKTMKPVKKEDGR
jgi:hypothetical protein